MAENRLQTSNAILLRLDTDSREQRSKRLSVIPTLLFPTTSPIPSRTFALLSEAGSCFVNGEYNGCVSVLATAVEYSLGDLLHSRLKLNGLIKKAKERGILNPVQAEVFDKLRWYRNKVIHSDLPELAKGIVLRVQDVAITEKGLAPSSDWSEVQPNDATMQEIAGSLAAESTVQDILLDTRRILCELYGGTVEGDV